MEPLLAICSHRDTLSIAFLILVFLHFLYIKKLSVFFNVCIIVLAEILRYPQAWFVECIIGLFQLHISGAVFKILMQCLHLMIPLPLSLNTLKNVGNSKKNRPSHLILIFLVKIQKKRILFRFRLIMPCRRFH